jgi:hypothetical protein
VFVACWADGEPNLITDSRPIYSLEHEIKAEGKFKLCNDDYRRIVSAQRDDIAAADLTLNPETQRFEVAFDGCI